MSETEGQAIIRLLTELVTLVEQIASEVEDVAMTVQGIHVELLTSGKPPRSA